MFFVIKLSNTRGLKLFSHFPIECLIHKQNVCFEKERGRGLFISFLTYLVIYLFIFIAIILIITLQNGPLVVKYSAYSHSKFIVHF